MIYNKINVKMDKIEKTPIKKIQKKKLEITSLISRFITLSDQIKIYIKMFYCLYY